MYRVATSNIIVVRRAVFLSHFCFRLLVDLRAAQRRPQDTHADTSHIISAEYAFPRQIHLYFLEQFGNHRGRSKCARMRLRD